MSGDSSHDREQKERVEVELELKRVALTWRMTDLMRAFTAGVRRERAVPWKYQRTIPPFVKMVKRSNIFNTS